MGNKGSKSLIIPEKLKLNPEKDRQLATEAKDRRKNTKKTKITRRKSLCVVTPECLYQESEL